MSTKAALNVGGVSPPTISVPTRSQSMAELSYEFVANMIHSATGEDGLKFFPFVFTLFIFVLCSNFFGMVPGIALGPVDTSTVPLLSRIVSP